MNKSISVAEAARILGKSPQFVRVGLQRNILPIGVAVQMSSKWTYHISPKLLSEYVGNDVMHEKGLNEHEHLHVAR